MVTKQVELTEGQANLVDRWVATGRHADESEAMRAALSLLEREEAEIADLRLRLEASLDEALAGDFAEGSGEEVIREVFAAACREG